MKLTDERLWWLKGFSQCGWCIGRPMLVGVKKWDAHTGALVKMALLEADGFGHYRITEAGLDALHPTPSEDQKRDAP